MNAFRHFADFSFSGSLGHQAGDPEPTVEVSEEIALPFSFWGYESAWVSRYGFISFDAPYSGPDAWAPYGAELGLYSTPDAPPIVGIFGWWQRWSGIDADAYFFCQYGVATSLGPGPSHGTGLIAWFFNAKPVAGAMGAPRSEFQICAFEDGTWEVNVMSLTASSGDGTDRFTYEDGSRHGWNAQMGYRKVLAGDPNDGFHEEAFAWPRERRVDLFDVDTHEVISWDSDLLDGQSAALVDGSFNSDMEGLLGRYRWPAAAPEPTTRSWLRQRQTPRHSTRVGALSTLRQRQRWG